MIRREVVEDSFAEVVSRLDRVLNPWGFHFRSDGVELSHAGPFASGHYSRGTTRIGISCRETLDNLYYEHAFVRQHVYSRTTETFTVGHGTLMRELGHADDCMLFVTNEYPNLIAARYGGDTVAALINDLTQIAAVVLREPDERFEAIVRLGSRCYSTSN